MRRKYYYKVMAVLTVVGLTVMSGCGDAKGKEEEAAAVGIETEVIPENENAGDSVENLGNGNETGANEGNEDKGSGDKEAAEEEKTEKGEENGGEKAQPDAVEGEPEIENSIVWDDINGEGVKTIEGTVKDIEEGSFVISQIYTGKIDDGDGGEVAVTIVGSGEEENLITVNYNEDVRVVVRTSTDGMTSTEKPGSISDLQKESNVSLTGVWEGEIFRVEEISIFILDM